MPGFELEADATEGKGAVPKRQRASAKPLVTAKEIDGALAAYNAAAEMHGFSPCRTLTDTRRKRLGARLHEIGGVDTFKGALNAIPRNDFLMGKVRPKNSGAPFKLDIDRLLSTESGMGDVLAKLVDAAGDTPNRQKTYEDEVQELAASAEGQNILRENGAEAGMRIISEAVADSRRSCGRD